MGSPCQHPKPLFSIGSDVLYCGNCGAIKRRADPEWRLPKLTPNVKTSKPKASKQLTEEQEQAFNGFWTIYPRKDAKEDARKAWIQMWKVLPEQKELQKKVKAYREMTKFKANELVKQAGPWLRGMRWEDESLGRFVVEEKRPDKIVNLWEEKIANLQAQQRAMIELGTDKALKIADELRLEINELTQPKEQVQNL